MFRSVSSSSVRCCCSLFGFHHSRMTQVPIILFWCLFRVSQTQANAERAVGVFGTSASHLIGLLWGLQFWAALTTASIIRQPAPQVRTKASLAARQTHAACTKTARTHHARTTRTARSTESLPSAPQRALLAGEIEDQNLRTYPRLQAPSRSLCPAAVRIDTHGRGSSVTRASSPLCRRPVHLTPGSPIDHNRISQVALSFPAAALKPTFAHHV